MTEPYGLEGVLYYPYAFYHLSGSVWFCALFLLSLLVAYAFRRDRNVRFLLVLVILQMVMGELHHDKVERHIFPILPALFLLAGYAAAEGWTRLQGMRNGLRVVFDLRGSGSAPPPRGQSRGRLDASLSEGSRTKRPANTSPRWSGTRLPPFSWGRWIPSIPLPLSLIGSSSPRRGS